MAQIRELNQRFYTSFAQDFSDTRQRIQPGVASILDQVGPEASVLDLGCGNGSAAAGLAARGHSGEYAGLDASAELVAIAGESSCHPRARFLAADLCEPDWDAALQGPFEHIFCFAVLHHIPGENLRARVVKRAAALLQDGGSMWVSVWNFMASERLKARILPWSAIDIEEREVESGDTLLDWRRGGSGIRYVHHFSEDELAALAASAGLQAAGTIYSDGENGRLGLYQCWQHSG